MFDDTDWEMKLHGYGMHLRKICVIILLTGKCPVPL
jgi:hypothetical protein